MDIKGTLHSLFEEQVRRHPRQIAGIFAKQSITYAELNKRANQLAHYLISKGLRNDEPVALCMDRSFDLLIAMMAVLKAGGAYLPIDANHPSERLLYILENSKAPILITDSAYANQFSGYAGTSIILDKEHKKIRKQANTNPNLASACNQLAYIIYTSGSTGTPKGVLIQHNSVINYCNWLTDYCDFKAKDRVDFSSNHIFDMAVTTTIASLVLGATIVLCTDDIKINPRLYIKYLRSKKINVAKLTPSYFKILVQDLKSKPIKLPRLKTIIMGGEAISSIDCKAWLKAYPKQVIYNEYGPSETTVGVTVFAVSHANASKLETSVPIGKQGPNIQSFILDNEGKPVAEGESGELYLGGLCLARGYVNQPELTAKSFVPDPANSKNRLYKTGDLCRLLPSGDLDYIGRIDDQVKIRGFRIEPAEVEKHLLGHAAIKAAVVVAQKDLLGENQLLAYYIVKDATEALTNKQLRMYLQQHVPDYMIPRSFVRIESIPLTANGKLDKAALPRPQLIVNENYKEPISELEKSLAQIWSKELGVTNIGLEDDFFELGGHSLTAGRVISMINSLFGKNINLRDFYEAPTIAKLAPVIDKAKKSKRARLSPSKRWLTKVDDIPLSDFQFLLWMAYTFESKVRKLNITFRKRLQGHLQKEALEFALTELIKKQEVFNYHIFKFSPAQMLVKKQPIKIMEQNLEGLSQDQCEMVLDKSMEQLIAFYKWTKKAPLIKLKLFYLPGQTTELQICMPHFIADDFSPDLLLTELSYYYEFYQINKPVIDKEANKSFREYVFREQFYFKNDLDRDIKFWDQYLYDASLLTFPASLVVKKMHESNIKYSSYISIPEQSLTQLKRYCAEQHISILDGLVGLLSLALIKCSRDFKLDTPYVFMNLVKSTRDNEIYDETIGCFLRVEPVKILLEPDSTLASLSAQIHKSAIETSLHQRCPGIIKLASTYSVRKKNNPIVSVVIRSLASLYAVIVKAPQIYRKIFNIGGVRLAQFNAKHSFLININMQQNFINESNTGKNKVFGMKSIPVQSENHDILSIDNVIDVCFLRDVDQDIPYLVLSANLKPEFRETLANEMLQIMGSLGAPSKRSKVEKVTP